MTEEQPGSERWTWLAEGNARQARKRVSVDVLIRDNDGDILLVNPSYKDGWDLPGGMAEENESPTSTGRREIMEELSIDVTLNELLVVDWVRPHGPWDDMIAMIFDGGVLSEKSKRAIKIGDDEVVEFDFMPYAAAIKNLPLRVSDRLQRAHDNLGKAGAIYKEEFATWYQ